MLKFCSLMGVFDKNFAPSLDLFRFALLDLVLDILSLEVIMVRHVGCYQIGDWQFDVDTMVLCLDSEFVGESGSSYHHDRKAHSLKLPFKTADLLALLAEYRGEIVPLDVIAQRVWDGDTKVAKRGIVNTISKIRRILIVGEFDQYIVNEPLKGYRLCVPVEIIDNISQPIPTPPEACFAQVLGWTAQNQRKRRRKHFTEPIRASTEPIQIEDTPTKQFQEQSHLQALSLSQKLSTKFSQTLHELGLFQRQQQSQNSSQFNKDNDNNKINHLSWRAALVLGLLAAIGLSISASI